jgi:hypothetical protein
VLSGEASVAIKYFEPSNLVVCRLVPNMKSAFFTLCAVLVFITACDTRKEAASSRSAPWNLPVSTDRFQLIPRPRDFTLQFASDGKTKQITIPRDWLIPPEDERDEEGTYVTSFHYDKTVSSFPIGNGRTGLHFSSYEIQSEGSAQAAAGRDVFVIFDPQSSTVFRGGIDGGITKHRLRSQGCFEASVERYFLADVDGDGFTDIGMVKEELQCLQKSYADVDIIVGPFYKRHPVVWHVFRENEWKPEPSFSGKFPEHFLELPLIGIERNPVDFVGCTLWRTCDRTKWPTGENDQRLTDRDSHNSS